MGKFKVNLGEVHNLVGGEVNTKLNDLLEKHEVVFANELSKLNGPKVKLHVDPEVMP